MSTPRPTSSPPSAALDLSAAVRRNVVLLAAGMAALYGMVELATAVATLTFVEAGGPSQLAGLAPGAFLATAALAALPAGRAMDRFGRVPVLAAGFGTGICGSLTAALGAATQSVVAVVVGFLLAGAATGTVMLSRTAAADMYPPERRARGIGIILFGAVFGALLGPAVFIPLVSAGQLGGSSLAVTWVGAAGFMLVGLGLMAGVRPDPQRLARTQAGPSGSEPASPDPLSRIVRRRAVPPVLLAAATSWAAMAMLMTLVGAALHSRGHDQAAIFPVLSAHFVGMFALFLLVGRVIDRVGRSAAMVIGLVLLSASALAVAAVVYSVALTAVALFGVGLGWSFAYVAATAELSEHASPAERGRLLGGADLLSGLAAGTLTVLGGLALARLGLLAVSLTSAVLPLVAALWILHRSRAYFLRDGTSGDGSTPDRRRRTPSSDSTVSSASSSHSGSDGTPRT